MNFANQKTEQAKNAEKSKELELKTEQNAAGKNFKRKNTDKAEEADKDSSEVSDLFKDLEKSEMSEFMFDMSEKKTTSDSRKPKSQPNIGYLGSLSNNINQVIFKYNSFHFPENLKMKSFKEGADTVSKMNLDDSLIKLASLNKNQKNMFNNVSCVNIINHSEKTGPAKVEE